MGQRWLRLRLHCRAKRLKGKGNLGRGFERVVELRDDLRCMHGDDHELPYKRGGRQGAQVQLLLHIRKVAGVQGRLQVRKCGRNSARTGRILLREYSCYRVVPKASVDVRACQVHG